MFNREPFPVTLIVLEELKLGPLKEVKITCRSQWRIQGRQRGPCPSQTSEENDCHPLCSRRHSRLLAFLSQFSYILTTRKEAKSLTIGTFCGLIIAFASGVQHSPDPQLDFREMETGKGRSREGKEREKKNFGEGKRKAQGRQEGRDGEREGLLP